LLHHLDLHTIELNVIIDDKSRCLGERHLSVYSLAIITIKSITTTELSLLPSQVPLQFHGTRMLVRGYNVSAAILAKVKLLTPCYYNKLIIDRYENAHA